MLLLLLLYLLCAGPKRSQKEFRKCKIIYFSYLTPHTIFIIFNWVNFWLINLFFKTKVLHFLLLNWKKSSIRVTKKVKLINKGKKSSENKIALPKLLCRQDSHVIQVWPKRYKQKLLGF